MNSNGVNGFLASIDFTEPYKWDNVG